MERHRITSDASVYYITWSVVEWLPVFIAEESCRIVTDSFRFCYENKGLRINSFVIMPTHLHAIVFHKTFRPEPLEQALTDCRKFTGKALADFCDRAMPLLFQRDAQKKLRNRSRTPFLAAQPPPCCNRIREVLRSETQLSA